MARSGFSGPEIAEAEGNRIEGADAHRLVVLRARDQQPLSFVQLKRLEGQVEEVPGESGLELRVGVAEPAVVGFGTRDDVLDVETVSAVPFLPTPLSA